MTLRPLRSRALLAASAVVAGLGIFVVPSVSAAETTTPLTAAGTAVETRDPLKWPFARNSIWNTPIGSSAKYVPAGLQAANASSNRITIDPEHIAVDPNAPIKTLRTPTGQPGNGAQVRVTPDLAHNGSWNGCTSLLTPDGKAVWQGQPLQLTAGGDPYWKWTTQKTAVDLRGAGIEGCHGGSHMSGIGGTIRTGELNSSAPLRHALKINLYCEKYCYGGTSMADSKRWPALTADAYWATRYNGPNAAVKMGALLALPPSTDLSGITNVKARKIAIALRDFGGYLVDDTAWDVHALSADKKVVTSGEWPKLDTVFHAQLQKVFTQLAVVDNNTATSVGGGGTRRAPLAPCFADDAACIAAETPVATPSPTASPVTATPSPTASPVTATPSPTASPVTTTPPATTAPTATADPYVSSLTPTAAVNGHGPYSKDRSNGGLLANDGLPLTIGGQVHTRGLGVHAGSAITYNLGKRYAHLSGSLGMDDEVAARGTVVFEVWADGKRVFVSPKMTGSSPAVPLSLSVWDVSTLKLVVTDAGDGISYDHADWGSLRLWDRTTTVTSPTTTTTAPTPTATVDPYVSALTPTAAVNGLGVYSKDRSNGGVLANDGLPLTIGGKVHTRGLGVHAGSALTYNLGKRYAHLSGSLGMDDEVGARGTVVFEVWADGKRVFVSPKMTGSSPAVPLNLSVWDVSTLKLVVTAAGDGISYDHADWGSLRLWSRG